MKAVLFFAVLLGPQTTWASGYSLQQQGAETGSMGHTGSTLQDSAEAAWFNPSLLTDDGGWRLSTGATLVRSRLSATALETSPDAPWSVKTEPSLSLAPHLYASVSKDKWSVGLTLNAAHASSVKWPSDWPQRFDIIESKPQFFRTTAFGAFRIGAFSFAVGPQIDTGQVYIHKATNHIYEEGAAQLALRGVGWGLHGGLGLKVNAHWTVGLRYFSRTKPKLKGEADFDVPLPFASAYPDQKVTSNWTLPDHIQLGGRWNSGTFSVAFELGLTIWSVQDVVTFNLEDSDPLTVQYHWRNSVSIKSGVEWSPSPTWWLRGGVYTDGLPAPAPKDTLSPASPDATRVGLTVGGSHAFNQGLKLNLSYEAMKLLKRTSESPDAPLAHYEGGAHMLGLSLAIQIP